MAFSPRPRPPLLSGQKNGYKFFLSGQPLNPLPLFVDCPLKKSSFLSGRPFVLKFVLKLPAVRSKATGHLFYRHRPFVLKPPAIRSKATGHSF